MPYTKGFENSVLLNGHFKKHKHHFGVTTEEDYESLADEFCGGDMDANTVEHVRSDDKAIVRYNKVTNEFGILGDDGYLKTYFKPKAKLRYFLGNCR